MKVFALILSGNYQAELQRLVVTKYLPGELQETFFPDLGETPTFSTDISSAATELLRSNLALTEKWEVGGTAVGSNAWAVSGKHTESGHSMLASDPHLGLQLPSLWYAVVQNTDNINLSGMSLVGMPLVVFGQNKHFAWGGTSMEADVQDLRIETLKGDGQNYYWSDGQWEELSTRIEKIKIKADFPAFLASEIEPINLKVRETKNGPIISDHLGINEVALSLRWTGLDKQDLTYQSMLELNRATDWVSFREALKKFKAPAMNIVYADIEGNIALQGVGALPVRKQHSGAFPVREQIVSDFWNGYVPFEQMPLILNPANGFVANANNHISRQGPVISVDEVEKARMQRIEELLENTIETEGTVTLADMKSMQLDLLDTSAGPLLQLMINLPDPSDKHIQLIELLKSWDQRVTRESVAASIYFFWFKNVKKQLFDDHLSQIWSPNKEIELLRSLTSRVTPKQVADILSQDDPWCLSSTLEEESSCSSKLRLALQETVEEITLLVGDDTESWRWGDMHYSSYVHQPFSQINGLKTLFGREYPSGGATNTLNVAGSRYKDKLGYRKEFGAGFRQVVVINASQPEHWIANAGGQSGQLMSEHYDDLLISFERGDFITLLINNKRPRE